jgi:AraC family transcriptional regulator of adaptative response/methylated-DNA-[protein]-cysteine methyltransferase
MKNVNRNAERVRELCLYIETHLDEPLRLADLAARAGLSPFHLQRSFRAVAGVTPKQYVDAARVKRLKSELREARDVTRAVYEAGYASAGNVYERAGTQLGMTPNQYRRGGRGVAITYALAETPLGLMAVGATDRGICFVRFGDSGDALRDELRREYPSATVGEMGSPHHADFEAWIAALRRHLAGRQPHVDLPLDVRATAFQLMVWSYLQSIPYGDVRSYAEVAAGIGKPKAARAVARACATNQVAVLIPCHRVIRGTGELGGYRWGLGRKRTLIERERATRPLETPTPSTREEGHRG